MSKQAISTDSHTARAPGMERDSSSPFPSRVVFIVSPLPSSVLRGPGRIPRFAGQGEPGGAELKGGVWAPQGTGSSDTLARGAAGSRLPTPTENIATANIHVRAPWAIS